jgi:hypothetical protein
MKMMVVVVVTKGTYTWPLFSPSFSFFQAAERRSNISRSCPSNSEHETQVAAEEQAEQELLHGIQVITIDDGDDDDEPYPATRSARPPVPKREHNDDDDDDEVVIVDVKRAPEKPMASAGSSLLSNQTRAAAALRQNLLSDSADIQQFRQDLDTPTSREINHQSKAWTCQRCTLRNGQSSLKCQACEEIRPGLPHWICSRCRHQMMGDYAEYWLCTKCGQIKVA